MLQRIDTWHRLLRRHGLVNFQNIPLDGIRTSLFLFNDKQFYETANPRSRRTRAHRIGMNELIKKT